MPVFEIAVVILLICVNGVLAMSELAVVSARASRLRPMAVRGSKGAETALKLAAEPGRFLSTVQIGITLVGVLSGAFSGATLGARLSAVLVDMGVPTSIASTLGVGAVVATITYASLIIGELVPKQIALRNPEAVASRIAPAMQFLSVIAAPLVWLLDVSGRIVLKVLGQTGDTKTKVTDEEIASLIAEAETHGVVESDERKMIAGVMRLADRSVRAIMSPRGEVDWLDLTGDMDALRKQLLNTPHSLLPAGNGTTDAIIGVVRVREPLSALADSGQVDITGFVHSAPVVPDNADALDVLTILKEADVPVALVYDEYGDFEGIVTPADILETIVGVFKSDLDDDEPSAVERDDGSWLLSGSLPVDELVDILGLSLPESHDYTTLAGFILAQVHHLPSVGEYIDTLGWRFEVVDLDGRRIDKVLASRHLQTHREIQAV